jgi:hypothetical protein
MKEHVITVDVYASWSDVAPRYRVYVDNDLLTERDFIWGSRDIYIRENIIVHLEAGQHSLRVDHVNNSNGSIRTENVTVNGAPSTYLFNTD